MADWTPLPNQAVGVGGLPSGTTVTALRDNPVAIAEGAPGAPKIQYDAIDEGLAQQPAGGLGTYAFLGVNDNSHTSTFGQTRAGSQLFPAGISSSQGFAVNGFRGASSHGAQNSARAGTWRCMGVVRSDAPSDPGDPGRFGASLWLRIS